MPRQHDYDPNEFSGITSLRTLAEREDLQASDKPVFATTFGEQDGEYRISNDDSAARAHATQLDDWKLVYNDATGDIFDVVTDDYEVINPPAFIGPLCDELDERERGDITGTAYLRDDGGAAYAQVLFTDTHSIYPTDRNDGHPIRCGFEVTWSHDSGMSVNVSGFAQDTSCKNSIREVTSPIHVKHAGDVDERIDWHDEWATVLDQMGAFSENLAEIIEEAMDYTLFDLRERDENDRLGQGTAPAMWLEQTDPLDTLGSVAVPGPLTEDDRDGFHAFYELLGFPRYIATGATERLLDELRQQDDPRVVSAWRVYSGATYALTHAYRGSAVNVDDKFRRANDILLNPEKTLHEARDEALARSEPDDEQRIMWADSEAEAADSTGDALRQYNERARALDETFTDD